MKEQHSDQKTHSSDADQNLDGTPQDSSRRRFFRTAGAAGLIGTVGGLAMSPLGPRSFAQQGQYDFARPANLRPGAQLDSRFPVSFAEPVTEGLRLIMAFNTALNQRDVAAMAATLHFPFAIYEDIEPLVFETRADFISNPPPTLNASGRGFTRIAEDSYDLLEGFNVHLYCPVGGVFFHDYARYHAQGFKLFDCRGVYSVTNIDGRWAIQLISTIWHEVGCEGNEYPDAEISHRIGSQGYLSAFGYNDEALLNGYWRYTADGTLISETRGVGIRIWRAGHWGDAGGLGQVTHHDRSNSPDL